MHNLSHSIITVTFNPALDKSITVPDLLPEQKLRCSVPVCTPGGGGINVARAITRLGGNTVAFYLGGGYAGDEISGLLAAERVNAHVIPISGQTRENLLIFDTAHTRQYLLDIPGPLIAEQEWRRLLSALALEPDIGYIVVSGSLPPGVPFDIFNELSTLARSRKARLCVDTSGEGLKAAVNAGVYLIKPNLRELAALCGIAELVPATATAAAAARSLINSGRCRVVVTSMGENGALLVSAKTAITVRPPAVAVKSTVGAGDSLMAGVIMRLSKRASFSEALCYGVACGTAATLRPGAELSVMDDIQHIYRQLQPAIIDVFDHMQY